jgi:hypothetical protein
VKNTGNILKGLAAALLLMCISHVAGAQNWAVSTNALSWINIGTINAEASLSVSQHVSLNAGFTANPWQMNTPTYVNLKNRQYGGYVGMKYWPWHVYSEWWVGVKAQYKNFEQVGLLSPNLMQGDAVGAGLSAGYTFMISNHFNIDLGMGLWGGRLLRYREFEGNVAVESKLVDVGPRNFTYLDNVIVALVYIF